jgi:hypothetical protein
MNDNFSTFQIDCDDKRGLYLAKAFDEICGSEIPFLLPQNFNDVISEIPTLAEELEALIGSQSSGGRNGWNLELIVSMLKKGYNLAALAPTLVSARLCAESLPAGNTDNKIIELGCGAGWSTLILYNILNGYFDRFTIVTIDESVYAISCTAQLFERFRVPYCIVKDDKILLDKSKNHGRPPVTLRIDDFISGLRSHSKETVHAIYSNHGTAYLSPEKHSEMLAVAHSVLLPKGAFISDSLTPQILLDLSKLFVIFSILIGNNRERFSKIPHQYRYRFYDDPGSVRVLRAVKNEATARFLDWLSFLLYTKQWGVLKEYLSGLRQSVQSQRKLREWVRVPSSHLHSQSSVIDKNTWQSSDLLFDVQVPYIETVRLVK